MLSFFLDEIISCSTVSEYPGVSEKRSGYRTCPRQLRTLHAVLLTNVPVLRGYVSDGKSLLILLVFTYSGGPKSLYFS